MRGEERETRRNHEREEGMEKELVLIKETEEIRKSVSRRRKGNLEKKELERLIE